MSTRESNNITTKKINRFALGAIAAATIEVTHSVSEPTIYNVTKPVYPPTHPTFIELTGGLNRAAIRFDTGNASIGTKPIEFTFYWRKLTLATSGNITVCIRKASDDAHGSGGLNTLDPFVIESLNNISMISKQNCIYQNSANQ